MAASFFTLPPAPKSVLGYHRVLSPTAGVKVSPICLGGMNFGTAWKDFTGECSKETAFEIMDYFFDMGGNFIDTANVYQNEESEQMIGEWMEKRGNRDQMVIATKYTGDYRYASRDKEMQINYGGNSTKSLHLSVNASLKKLKTDYIDVLYVHWWDFTTSVEELMQSLNILVNQGKVLYLGVSDTPAWIVVKANAYARQHGLRTFSVYSGLWNAATRDIERDVIPMCIDEGLGIAPFSALGAGQFKSKEQREANIGEGRVSSTTENDIKVSEALEKIAQKKNTSITSIAFAYVMHKTPYVFPIVGCRKLEHLKGNIEALSIELAQEEIDEIEDAVPFVPEFPYTVLFGGAKYNLKLGASDVFPSILAGFFDTPPKQGTIKPRAQV